MNKEDEVYLRKKQLLLYKNKLRIKYPKLWIAQYHHLNTRGQKMSFDTFPFLVEIYQSLEKSKILSVMKAVQLGFSEAFIVDHLDNASKGLAIQYVLPKGDIRNRFVQNRINRLTRAVKFYKNKLTDVKSKTDSVMLKRFGDGIINYVDSNSVSNFVEYPGDALYVDEEDRCNVLNVSMAVDRLSASPHALERYVGNPTIEENGIHKRWLNGSQGKWSFKCPHCNFWQGFNWFKNVVRQVDKWQYKPRDKRYNPDNQLPIRIFCAKCHGKISRLSVKSQWIHKYPSRSHKSFHIGKISSPFTTIHTLLRKFFKVLNDETQLQLFYNSDLGLPFTAEGSKITTTLIDKTCVPGYTMPDSNKGGLVYAGIDVGRVINIVIRKYIESTDGEKKKQALFIGCVKGEDEVIELLKRYEVKYTLIDALPEIRLVERLKERHNSVYSCEFGLVSVPKLNKKERILRIRRTPLLDRVLENLKTTTYFNPINLSDIFDYYKQMQSNTRILDVERNEFIWSQSSHADHYHLSEGYAEGAYEIGIGGDVFHFYEDISKEKVEEARYDFNSPLSKSYDDPDDFFKDLNNRRYNVRIHEKKTF